MAGEKKLKSITGKMSQHYGVYEKVAIMKEKPQKIFLSQKMLVAWQIFWQQISR